MVCLQRAIVVGGGIGGMVAAIAMRKRGIEVEVIEASRREDQLGTGINLQNNALRGLHEVGLYEKCANEGFAWNTISNRSGETGEIVNQVNMPWPPNQGLPGALGIMRTDFAEILAHGANSSGVNISYQTKVTELNQDADGVTVQLSDGRTLSADILVAADGVYSQIRSMVFGPEHKPSYIGQGVWRFTVPRPKSLDGFSLFRTKEGASLGFLPLSEEIAYYFYLETTPEPLRVPPEEASRMMAERLAQFTAPQVQEVMHCLEDGWHVSFRPFDILFMPGPWHSGRVVMLGDVAHSLTPQLTSGAGMAIEDAVVLADELGRANSIEGALSAYSARRIDRAQMVFRNSLRICELEKNPDPTSFEGTQVMLDSFALLSETY